MSGGNASSSVAEPEAPRDPARAARANARRGLLVGLGFALVGLLGFLGFLVFAAGAGWSPATAGLVLAAGSLLLALRSLFHMARVLARPSVGLEFDHEAFLVAEGRRELQEERRRLLRAINELKFDHEMGKLSDADYREVRQGYELKAIEVMRALEADDVLDPDLVAELRERGLVVPELVGVAPAPAGSQAAAAESEADLVAPGAEPSEVAVASPVTREDDAPVALGRPLPPESRSLAEPPSTLPVCAGCRSLNDTDAKFCKHCGAKLK